MAVLVHRVAVAIAVVLLTGRVLDRTTGQPLAHVRVSSGHVSATTDSAGRFSLRGLHPGRAELLLESDDVPAQHASVTLGTGTTHRDLRACSTTLDYNCSSPDAPAAPGGAS
jgi:protocatechuate 3,4-dioxygenase beta subunit